MALDYTYTNYKDVHTLQNDESIVMNYEIIKNSCDANSSISTGTISPGNTITINYPVDGDYTINLSTSISTDSITVKYYQNLLKSFIADAEKLLCGCVKCKDCEECNECQDYLGAFMKAYAVNSINYLYYQVYLDLLVQETSCEFTQEVICTILNEKVFGSSSVKEPMLKILSYYYLAFYFKDFYSAADEEEEMYISAKYKYDKLSKCIKKLGINPADIINQLEEGSMVYFWQLENTEESITEVIPLLSPSFIAGKASLPLEIFEQGHIVGYSQIGRICFAIMPTQVQNFLITDSLNNDVTDEFDIHYENSMSLALFVSKIPYSHSNIYFKFKKLT